jgi:hypothetical protein
MEPNCYSLLNEYNNYFKYFKIAQFNKHIENENLLDNIL